MCHCFLSCIYSCIYSKDVYKKNNLSHMRNEKFDVIRKWWELLFYDAFQRCHRGFSPILSLS